MKLIKITGLLIIVLIAIGCSSDGSFQSPTKSNQMKEDFVQKTIAYDGLLIELPEGWEPIDLRGRADRLDTPRDRSGGNLREGSMEEGGGDPVNSWVCTSRRAERDIPLNQIHYNWTGCWIPGSALPRNRLDIEVCVDTLQAICEFGPHGTNFLSDIWIRIDFQYLGLDDQGINLETEVGIFYVEDNGTLTLMPHWVDWTGHALVGLTNHFSRYIITTRTR